MFESALFLLQLAVIIGTCRVVAWIFRRIGQSQVVGEMAAGIALGPTVFGFFAPQAFHSLFPPESLPFLNALSQIGLVIFVFLVGVRIDFRELRPHGRLASATSIVSIVVPLAMGGILARYLFPRYGTSNETTFALFIGTATSVTAFPVLARILMERDLLNTRIGTLAIACAAVADLAAWTLLTIVTVLTQQARGGFWREGMPVILLTYVACVFGMKHILRQVSHRWKTGGLPPGAIAVLMVLATLSAGATEWMGLHALIGAFVAGLITPRHLSTEMVQRLEPMTLVLLVPIFFAVTGIKASFLFSPGSGEFTDLLFIVAIAVVSKWGAASVTARWMGLPWNEASQLGLMLNTRGLVELIVLNVGLETGIISHTLYSLLVCMAIVTTMMATPLLDWTRRAAGRSRAAVS